MSLNRRSGSVLRVACVIAGLAGCASIDRKQPDKELVPENVLEIEVRDAKLDVSPAHIDAGRVDLDITNHGLLEHIVRIEGKGLDEPSDTSVASGQHRRITIRLKPGTYRIFCPDANHAEQGISATLDVDEAPTSFHR